MAEKASSTQLVHIRMPKALHRRLTRDGDQSGQTLNAEILRRLHRSYVVDDDVSAMRQMLGEIVPLRESRDKTFAELQKYARELKDLEIRKKEFDKYAAGHEKYMDGYIAKLGKELDARSQRLDEREQRLDEREKFLDELQESFMAAIQFNKGKSP